MQRVWRVLIGMALIVGGFAASAQSQSYTLAPYPVQYFTDAGAVCNGCLLNAYLSGTSTRRDTYSDTSGTANANPVAINSSGRATVYLAVGVSYRLVLTNSTGGTTYFDVDPVQAVPASAGNLDLTATAGEAIALGDVIYLSDGAGSTTAGRWYRADADNTYSSSAAGAVGIAPAAIASAATGTARIAGRMTGLSGLTAGELYYASATVGALTATPPTNQRFIGEADTTSTLILNGGQGGVRIPDSAGAYFVSFITTSTLTADRRVSILTGNSNRQITLTGDPTLGNNDTSVTGSPVFTNLTLTGTCTGCSASAPTVPGGRLTLTSGTPVTTADVTAATTLYYAPYSGGAGRISLYDGASVWTSYALSEISIAVPATTSTMYDVFVYASGGVPTLELTSWTNDTTRATALTTQNGVYVRTGATTRLYVGSFRTTGVSGQTESSYAKRYVWNYYNRVHLPMRVTEATDSWAYTTATIRQANGSTANQLDFVIGVAEVELDVRVFARVGNTNNAVSVNPGIGLDSTTAFASGFIGGGVYIYSAGTQQGTQSEYRTYPAAGRHYATWLEHSEATGTTTWYGDNGAPTTQQSGISGSIQG